VRAREIRWKRDPAVGDVRGALLRQIEGLEVGQRPEAGIFQGDRFLHPVLGFSGHFPSGWQKSNTNRAVGAAQPRGETVVFVTADAPRATWPASRRLVGGAASFDVVRREGVDAVMNAVFADHRFQGGELVEVARVEPHTGP
jgi:predicted Zn-dependent protease